jgi:RNA polymerase sigma factor (sigma-70 family)
VADDLRQHLSQINTIWTMVFQAHQGQPEAVSEAQQQLLQRYSGAIYRYLLAVLRDPHEAEELAQEFALHFIRGDFRRASPSRGRFRDLVKTAVLNLCIDHYRRRQTRAQNLPELAYEKGAWYDQTMYQDTQFLETWREELLNHTWEGLTRLQEETGQPYHEVLRFRADHPETRSAAMAEELGRRLGKPLTAAGVRQTLHRAREHFADLLLAEVALSLREPTREDLQEELGLLRLLKHCDAALERWVPRH